LKPHHHLDDSTILAYAAGTLNEAFRVVAASHLVMCSDCRRAVRHAEALGGEMLDQLSNDVVSDSCRAKTMAALDRAILHRFPRAAATGSELPEPLARLIAAATLDDIAWKTKAPGVATFDVAMPKGAHGNLKLLRIGAGRAMPEHGHGGEEITLILKGAYRDHLGRFARGDVADLDEEIEHKPVVEQDSVCICLVATERPTRFKSLAARIMQPFVGI
jgi:putative transcriptional regulator